MNHRVCLSTLACLIIAALSGCSQTPQPDKEPAAAAANQSAPWYEPEIHAFEAADKISPPSPGQVLFVGSSSFRLWKSLAHDMSPAPVLNRAFGGSKTGEVLAVFDRTVPAYKPKVIAYYCGDNDLGTDNTDSESAANGFIAFDQRARALWPRVRVLYVAIKPSLQRWSNWAAMKKANDLVREYCERTPGATFLDIATPMFANDGRPDPTLFREDGLHVNEKGYEVWAKVIQPAVVKAWRD